MPAVLHLVGDGYAKSERSSISVVSRHDVVTIPDDFIT